MICKAIFGLLLTLAMVGCGDITSCETSTAPMAATSEKEVLRGLQSLQRVQLKLVWLKLERQQSPAEREAMQKDAIKQLRKLLPQLDTTGTTDDWTLEFAFGVSFAEIELMTAVPPPTPRGERVPDCRCRLVRAVVVDGRAATAIAYERLPVTRRPFGWAGGLRLRSDGSMSNPLAKQLLRDAIAGFAKAWRQANPDTHQK